MSTLRGSVASAAALAALACGAHDFAEPDATAAYEILFRATDERGRAVAGAAFSTTDQALGVTSASGELAHALRGREGSTLSIKVKCPAGHEPVEEAPPLRLHTLRALAGGAESKERLRYSVRCERTERTLAVVVRSRGATDVPVLVNGARQGSTDADGVAHFAYSLAPGAPVRVVLDTSAQPALRPQNPTKTFTVGSEDAVVLFDQKLEPERKPPVRARKAASPVRHIPYRLD
jgi:hypothetical protein